MGLRIGVRCDGCSYYDEMFVGGLRTAPFKEWQWPVFCRGCRSITTSRYSDGPLKCLTCGSVDALTMDDPSVYAGDGEHVLHSWFGAELPTMRPVMRSRRMERTGWRGVCLLLGRRLFGQAAYCETYWDEEPDYERHEIRDGHYLCPRCGRKTLRFPSGLQAMMFFD